MAQQVARQRLGVGRHVERFVLGDARIGTRGDVAYGVAARLARRHAGGRQVAHRRLGVVELDEVQLNVLSRGDVPEAARVALRDVSKGVELLADQDPLRNLDSQHLRIAGLPLAVRAAEQPEGAPLVWTDVPAFEPCEQRDELVDVRFTGEREPSAPECFAILDSCHYCPPAAVSSASTCAKNRAEPYDFADHNRCRGILEAA